MKVKSMKGFTLAELLIVMAIIVVLAAIAIPTFGKQLETARESADDQLLRAALTDAFTQAYVDYANDKAFTHKSTLPSSFTAQTAATGKVVGAYAMPITSVNQTVAGFEYITPKFNVGSVEQHLTETAKVGPSSDDANANYIVFEFQSGGAGNEAGITLIKATTIKS